MLTSPFGILSVIVSLFCVLEILFQRIVVRIQEVFSNRVEESLVKFVCELDPSPPGDFLSLKDSRERVILVLPRSNLF